MGEGSLIEDKASSFLRHYSQAFDASLSAELAHFGFDVQAAGNARPYETLTSPNHAMESSARGRLSCSGPR
jgi:hypothetical protein